MGRAPFLMDFYEFSYTYYGRMRVLGVRVGEDESARG